MNKTTIFVFFISTSWIWIFLAYKIHKSLINFEECKQNKSKLYNPHKWITLSLKRIVTYKYTYGKEVILCDNVYQYILENYYESEYLRNKNGEIMSESLFNGKHEYFDVKTIRCEYCEKQRKLLV